MATGCSYIKEDMMLLSHATNSPRAGALSAVFCVLLWGEPADAKATYVTFGPVQSVTGINATEDVTGSRFDGTGFIRTADGTLTTFAVSGASSTQAMNINNEGIVAGTYYTSGATAHGFARAADGTIARFDGPGSIRTFVVAINNPGEIIGNYNTNPRVHGLLRAADGRITTIDIGAASTWPAAINDKGAITGGFFDSDNGIPHGFIRTADGANVKFDVPEGTYGTAPQSINIDGVVTGYYYDHPNGNTHGFIRTPDGTITAFDISGCLKVYPTDINREGTVTGVCEIDDDHAFGFIRRPNGLIQKFRVPQNGLNYRAMPFGINNAGVIAGLDLSGRGATSGVSASYDSPRFSERVTEKMRVGRF